MPLCSWPVPGRKPGTSTNVIIGMLKASQNRTNLAPLTDELMSKQPIVKRNKRYEHSCFINCRFVTRLKHAATSQECNTFNSGYLNAALNFWIKWLLINRLKHFK